MPSYKLHYFDLRAKGELIRLVFAAAGEEFEDIRYIAPFGKKNPDLPVFDDTVKNEMPLGQMPVLEIDGVKYCQQISIASYLAKKFGLVGDTDLHTLKCTMVVETLWTDIASKIRPLFFTTDEEEKKKIKDNLIESLPKMLNKMEKWVEGKYMLGDKLSLADIALIDVRDFLSKHVPEVQMPEGLEKAALNALNFPNIQAYVEKRPDSEF